MGIEWTKQWDAAPNTETPYFNDLIHTYRYNQCIAYSPMAAGALHPHCPAWAGTSGWHPLFSGRVPTSAVVLFDLVCRQQLDHLFVPWSPAFRQRHSAPTSGDLKDARLLQERRIKYITSNAV